MLRNDPDAVFLWDEGGATWIRRDDPVRLVAHRSPRPETVRFAASFTVGQGGPAPEAILLRAFRAVRVSVDGHVLLDEGPPPFDRDWKRVRRVALPTDLAPGPHELHVAVTNDFGPPALLAWSLRGGLVTGPDWTVQEPDGARRRARRAADLPSPELPEPIAGTVPQAMARLWPVLLPIAGSVLLLVVAARRNRFGGFAGRMQAAPSAACWTSVAVFALLAVNNAVRFAVPPGFDAAEHFEYIDYVRTRCAIPFADQGWELFQSPLYYVVGAVVDAAAQTVLSPDASVSVVRLISAVCGIAQIVLVRRAGRIVFPCRPDLQVATILVGAWLPVNVYMAQALSNEPFAAAFSAWAVVLCLELLSDPAAARSMRRHWGMGIVLGLGLLSKVTALLLVPPACLALGWALHRAGAGRRAGLAASARLLLACGLVCGWYYAMNLWRLGVPFYVGWDQRRGLVWWQEPGYRTWDQYLSFGAALTRPFFSGVASYWDGMYSTLWLDGLLSGFVNRVPWQTDWMLAGAWLGLLPCAAMILGFGRIAWSALSCRPIRGVGEANGTGLRGEAAERGATGRRDALWFCGLVFAEHLAAATWLTLSATMYGLVKSSYLLGIVPCFAVATVVGLDPFLRSRILSPFVIALLATGLVASAVAYTYF